MEQVPSPLLTLSEAQEALRVSRMTLFRLMRRGELPVVRIGKRTFVRAATLETFVLERETAERQVRSFAD